MLKSKKNVFTIVILIILLVAAYGILERVIATHLSKSAIIEKLETATGYQVVIDGPLHWHYSFHPNLMIEKITFSSHGTKSITLENARMGIKIFPLLLKQCEVDFTFLHWQQNKLHFSNGVGQIHFANKILTVSDFKAQFYQGNIAGNAIVDLNTVQPKFKINIKTSQVEIAKLLSDIAHSSSVSGKVDANAILTSEGNNPAAFMQHLTGKIVLNVQEGKLHTIHFGEFIPNLSKEADFFDSLTITAPIENGIANTKIQLLAKNYRAEGNGKINFNLQSLALKLNVYYTRSQQTKNIAIPVSISGQIASPNVSVNLAKPLNQILHTDGNKLINKINQLFS